MRYGHSFKDDNISVERQICDGETVASSVARRHILAQELFHVQKRRRLNDKTMNPLFGELKCHLDRNVCHLPNDNFIQLKKRRLRCALHRWVNRNTEIRSMILLCSTCNIPLCVRCYKPFHTVACVKKLEDVVKKIIVSELRT